MLTCAALLYFSHPAPSQQQQCALAADTRMRPRTLSVIYSGTHAGYRTAGRVVLGLSRRARRHTLLNAEPY